MVATAFINYRRRDSDAIAGHLHDSLKSRLPDVRIFLDVDGVQGGDDFVRALANTLSSTDVMMTVIGPKWLTLRDADGIRRLDDPRDFVVMEIADALQRNVSIVPVLVEGAKMPRSEELPTAIKALATRQAMVLDTRSWTQDVDALIERIEALLVDRTSSGDEPWRRGLRGRLDRFRRRVIPRSKTWQLVKTVSLTSAVLAVLVIGSLVVAYVRGADRRALEQAAVDLRYGLPLEVVKTSMQKVQQLAVQSGKPDAIDFAAAALKALVVNPKDQTDDGREIRARAISIVKALRQTDLTRDFGANDLKKADLVDADLSRAVLKHLSFASAFLLRTNFAAADLSGADLSSSYARNTYFGAATLTDATVRRFDWFNAEGFVSEQLHSVDLSTLDPCPKDSAGRSSESAFRRQMDEDYAFKWAQFPQTDQRQLLKVWSEYGTPGGLCDQVDSWIASRNASKP